MQPHKCNQWTQILHVTVERLYYREPPQGPLAFVTLMKATLVGSSGKKIHRT